MTSQQIGMMTGQGESDVEGELARLQSIIDEVHAWIVCAAIATAEDMMQNAERICVITAPDYDGDGESGEQPVEAQVPTESPR
jgi:hypothetical protein